MPAWIKTPAPLRLVGAGVAVCVVLCVCVGIAILVGTGNPHKDSKKRKIIPHGDISQFLTRTKAILGVDVRFRVRVTIRVRVRG